MANVIRIKAKDDGAKNKANKSDDAEITRKVTIKAKKSENKKVRAKENAEAKKAARAEKKAERKAAKQGKKVFILFRPFAAIGRYIKESFQEVRQVRWPDRKSTWKMTLSVVLYVILIATIIMLLDAFFTFIFSKILSNV